MKRFCVPSVLAAIGLLLAFSSPSGMANTDWSLPVIAGGECFIDTDKGEGNGKPLSIPNPALGLPAASGKVEIGTAGLLPGAHRVGIRFKNSAGTWGAIQWHDIWIEGSAPVIQPSWALPGITGVQCIPDSDASDGSVLEQAGDFGEITATGKASFNTVGVSSGAHRIGMRFQDSSGAWGAVQWHDIWVEGSAQAIQPSWSLPTVTGAEYFVDADPGEGQGRELTGDLAQIAATGNALFSTAGLSSGAHRIGLRFQDSAGVWGSVQWHDIWVEGSAQAIQPSWSLPTITDAEYFVDADPGEGLGRELTGDLAQIAATGNALFSTAGLSSGAHRIGLRFQDSAGVWGSVQWHDIWVEGSAQAIQPSWSLPTVTGAEYFVDADPGEGLGRELTGDLAQIAATGNALFSTAGLSSGAHRIGLRFQDSGGAWGAVQWHDIWVEGSAQVIQPSWSLPTVTSAEYFVDADPGEGLGRELTGDLAQIAATGNALFSTAGLSSGAHRIGLRFQDSTGVWGAVQWHDIWVEGRAQAIQPSWDLPGVSGCEYFVNEDPGEGRATRLPGAFGGLAAQVGTQIDSALLTPGNHRIGIRFSDLDGHWGAVQWMDTSINALSNYTVRFELGTHGSRIGGGELMQEVPYRSAAVSPEVEPAIGWHFAGWDKPFAQVETFLVVRALYTVAATVPEAVDNHTLSWTSGGAADWLGQTNVTYDGVDAARSGEINDSETSWLETTVPCSGSLSFRWKVSSQDTLDSLHFSIDEVPWQSINGDTVWQQLDVRVEGAGSHTLRWEYIKDDTLSEGNDCGWLDQVIWIPDYTGFDLWMNQLGLSGNREDEFANDRDGDDIANGFEYAFGTNIQYGLLSIRVLDGNPVVEIPMIDQEALPYVDVTLRASTNLNEWTLQVAPTNGAPSGRAWYRAEGVPDKAFFKLEAELK